MYDGAGLLAASGGSIQISGPNGQLNQHGWVDDLVLVFEDTDGAGPQSSTLSSRFLHGPAIDQIFAQESATGEVLWALADHQGTIRDWAESADFDNNGTTETEVVKHITIDASGNIQSVTDSAGAEIPNGTSEILHAFTGQLYDADAGLYYFRARWYDSSNGFFVNDDPLGFGAHDSNVGRFLGNNPTFLRDPTGLDEETPPHVFAVFDIKDKMAKDFHNSIDHLPHAGAEDWPSLIDRIKEHFEEHGPIDILIICDHGCASPKPGFPPETIEVDELIWHPGFGTANPRPPVISPSMIEEVKPYLEPEHPVIWLGMCGVGLNKPHMEACAEASGATILAPTDLVNYPNWPWLTKPPGKPGFRDDGIFIPFAPKRLRKQ